MKVSLVLSVISLILFMLLATRTRKGRAKKIIIQNYWWFLHNPSFKDLQKGWNLASENPTVFLFFCKLEIYKNYLHTRHRVSVHSTTRFQPANHPLANALGPLRDQL